MIAPVRSWQMGREEEVAYAREHGIPVKGGTEVAPYSIDDNLWGRSSRGALDRGSRPRTRGRRLPARHPPRARRPIEAEIVTVEFERGVPVALNGERLELVELLERAGRDRLPGTGSGSSTTSRTGSSGSRSATSTRCRRRRSCCSPTRSSRGWSARSTRTNSSRRSTSEWAYLVYAGLWWEPLRDRPRRLHGRGQRRR